MRPALLSPSGDALPASLRHGLAGTAATHAVVFAAIALAVILDARRSPPLSVMPVTVSKVVADAAPPPPVLIVTGPPLEAVDTMPPSAGIATIDGFRYDTSRIREHRRVLFPFLTGQLPFLDELRAAAAADRRRLHNPLGLGRGSRRASGTPLKLSAAARDALVDRTWSRRDRWKSLAPIVDLANRYDADEGQLPEVVRGHVQRNLLQPYFEASPPDARFWVMLGLAADHVDVIEFVGRYARKHPSSRTTTELLFLLAELTEASRGALELLIETDVAGLTHTAASSPEDVQLAHQLRRAYKEWTEAHGLDRLQPLDEHYDTVRLAILSTIVETSPDGYGVADASYLAGRVLWERNDIAGAVRWWRGMREDERTAYADVRAEIGRAIQLDGRVDVVRIVGALGTERGRWLRESSDRLARFGYTPQTF